jgi:hypothetical protein
MRTELYLPLDVLRLIIDACESRSTLALLAQTSQVVSELALDKLWYKLDNLYILAKCMPAQVWDEYETVNDVKYFHDKYREVVSAHMLY